MTHCQNLDDYLDRDLPPAAREEFEDHLLDCAECRAAVAQCGDFYAALAGNYDMPEAAGVARRLEQVIAAEVPSGVEQKPAPASHEVTSNHKFARQWIAAAAVVLIAGVLALQLLGSEDEFAVDTPPANEVDSESDRNREIDALLARRNNSATGNSNSDTNQANSPSPQDAVASNEPDILPSLVRQVGDSNYEQLKVKSNNPKVTIVWMMEPPTKAEETP